MLLKMHVVEDVCVGWLVGKFNRHIDYWDAVDNQQYFSWEAFSHVLQQMTDVTRLPKGLPTPSYTILRKFKDFEVRRCVRPFS